MHTLAPWCVNPIRLDQVCTADGRLEIGWATGRKSADETIANARVMAAAPDLLVALKDLLGLWQSQDRAMTTEEIAAEYAISKAEGTT